MTPTVFRGPLPPRTRGDMVSDDFVRGIAKAPPRCNALVLSDPTGHYFTARCVFHDWYGRERWHGADGKSEADQEAAWHTKGESA